eukprot:CAMPEP_0194365886 /NCGR_PEP_ID=MMETSP0174-20130528/13870_1 /TAXON_ID=216777 /ORGANISM="Proboscia alata, Strain PI-D3" /LENGTH=513 /DNA_ID=CAMNT_0039140749 /DNA_START=86 /DNA_END=1627 /DNA_ORIENTATION=+
MRRSPQYVLLAMVILVSSVPEVGCHMFETIAQRISVIEEFTARMDQAGYDVRIGGMDVFSKETCELPENAFWCKGNNPNSPYAVYNFPIIPNQEPFIYGTRMREDEAMVLIGMTPPLAEYFGFTMYLNSVDYQFGDVSGGYSGGHLLLKPPQDNRTHIQASLEDPINPSNINVTSDGTYYDAFDKDFVIIATGDNFMNDIIQTGLIDVDIPPNIFNFQTLSSEVINFGIEAEADVIGALFRTAFFNDPDEMNNYLNDIPLSLLRITPKVARQSIMPLPRPPRIPRSENVVDQSYLQSAYYQLARAVKKDLFGTNILESNSVVIDADPDVCIDSRTKCFFENTDAAYFGNLPGFFFPSNGHFVAIGINHVEAGYARYSSVTLYDAATFIAIGSFTNLKDMKGSADRYLPNHPLKDQLYAISFRRNCTNYNYCINVPENLLSLLSAMIFMERAYVDPNGSKGTDPAIMLPFRILYGEDPSLIPSLWKSGLKSVYGRLRDALFPEEVINFLGWPMA